MDGESVVPSRLKSELAATPACSLAPDREGFTQSFTLQAYSCWQAGARSRSLPVLRHATGESPSSAVHLRAREREARCEALAVARFFDLHGFVVIRDVLCPGETTATVQEVWDVLERASKCAADGRTSSQASLPCGDTTTAGSGADNDVGDDADNDAVPEGVPVTKGLLRHDRSTWCRWPPRGLASARTGMVCYEPVFSQQVVANRASLRVAAPFALLLDPRARGARDAWPLGLPVASLVAGADRCTLFRSTVAPITSVGRATDHPSDPAGDSVQDHPEWATSERNLHLDMNPTDYMFNESAVISDRTKLAYSQPRDLTTEGNLIVASEGGGVSLQGILNLVDNTASDGGFVCVPGFHRKFNEWVTTSPDLAESLAASAFSGFGRTAGRGNKRNRNRNLIFKFWGCDCEAELQRQAMRVTCRAGSLILFDARLPHGSRPNHSSNIRVVQFVRYVPETRIPASRRSARSRLVQRSVQRGAPGLLERLGAWSHHDDPSMAKRATSPSHAGTTHHCLDLLLGQDRAARVRNAPRPPPVQGREHADRRRAGGTAADRPSVAGAGSGAGAGSCGTGAQCTPSSMSKLQHAAPTPPDLKRRRLDNSRQHLAAQGGPPSAASGW